MSKHILKNIKNKTKFSSEDFKELEKRGFTSWDGTLEYAWSKPHGKWMWNPDTKVFVFVDEYSIEESDKIRIEKLLVKDIREAAEKEGKGFLEAIGDGDKTMKEFFNLNSWNMVLVELINYRYDSIIAQFREED